MGVVPMKTLKISKYESGAKNKRIKKHDSMNKRIERVVDNWYEYKNKNYIYSI